MVAALAPSASLAGRFSDAFTPSAPNPLTPEMVSGSFAKIGTAPATDDPNAPPADTKLDDVRKSLHDTKTKFEETLLGAERTLNGIAVPAINMPTPPQAKQTTPAQAWGSSAMMLATIGSLFTRRPLTTAMNAMASVLKGVREADQQKFDNDFKVWQQASQNALAYGSFQMQAYHAAIAGLEEKLSLGEKISEIEQRDALAKLGATGASLGDTTIQTMIQNEGLPGTIKYITDQASMWSQFQRSQAEAMQQGLSVSAFKEWQADQAKMGITPTAQASADKWKQLNNQYLVSADLTPEALHDRAVAYKKGDLQAAFYGLPAGQSGALARQKISNEAAELPDDGSDLASAHATNKALQTAAAASGRRLGATLPAVKEAEGFADNALAASEKMPRGQFVPLNAAANAVASGTSNPAMAAFVVANTSLVQAYAAAVSRTGVPTDSLRSHAYEMLNTAMSKEAYAAAIAQMKKELELAARAPEEIINLFGRQISGGKSAVEETVGGGSASASGDTSGLPTFSDPAEAMKLPPGTPFRTSDGRIKYVPAKRLIDPNTPAISQ